MLSEPKTIPLGDFIALTGERHLAFLPKDASPRTFDSAWEDARKSFAEAAGVGGLPFRADEVTLSVTLIPTMSCNLRCDYCYSDGGDESTRLNVNYAYAVIDSLLERFPDILKVNLFFAGGGEPLLGMDVIRAVVAYTRGKGLAVEIRIVTNGVQVPKYIPWLRDNEVYLRISYDGSAQTDQRPGRGFDSGEKLRETFGLLIHDYPRELVSTQMTITKANVDTLNQDVMHLVKEYGIQTLKIEPVQTSCSRRSASVPSPDPEDFTSAVLDTLDSLSNSASKVLVDLSYLSVPSTEYFCSLRNKIVISPYSVLSPCVELIRPGENGNLLLWTQEPPKSRDFAIIESFQRATFDAYHAANYPSCKKCNLVHICKANCPMRAILAHGRPGPYEYNCRISKMLIPRFLARAAEDDRYMRLVFGDSFSDVEES